MTPDQIQAMTDIIVKSALWGWDACRTGATKQQVEAAATDSAERMLKRNQGKSC